MFALDLTDDCFEIQCQGDFSVPCASLTDSQVGHLAYLAQFKKTCTRTEQLDYLASVVGLDRTVLSRKGS